MTTTDTERLLRAALVAAGDGSSDYDLNAGVTLPPGRKLRDAAVLIGVSLAGPKPMVILTKRSSALKHHPGQIAFPGGKTDEKDADAVATALREAHEEIALPSNLPKILGTLPPHETVTGFTVTPVLSLIPCAFEAHAEDGEVDEVFQVPLDHVTNPDNFLIQSRHWRGVERYFYVVPWGPYYIWGATARMFRALAARMDR